MRGADGAVWKSGGTYAREGAINRNTTVLISTIVPKDCISKIITMLSCAIDPETLSLLFILNFLTSVCAEVSLKHTFSLKC